MGEEVIAIVSSLGTLAIAVISYFLKRTISKQDEHDKDIQIIKQTYVSKNELKEFKGEFKASLDKLSEDVEDIKRDCLSKKDFMVTQTRTEQKIDKIYDLLIKGGNFYGN